MNSEHRAFVIVVCASTAFAGEWACPFQLHRERKHGPIVHGLTGDDVRCGTSKVEPRFSSDGNIYRLSVSTDSISDHPDDLTNKGIVERCDIELKGFKPSSFQCVFNTKEPIPVVLQPDVEDYATLLLRAAKPGSDGQEFTALKNARAWVYREGELPPRDKKGNPAAPPLSQAKGLFSLDGPAAALLGDHPRSQIHVEVHDGARVYDVSMGDAEAESNGHWSITVDRDFDQTLPYQFEPPRCAGWVPGLEAARDEGGIAMPEILSMSWRPDTPSIQTRSYSIRGRQFTLVLERGGKCSIKFGPLPAGTAEEKRARGTDCARRRPPSKARAVPVHFTDASGKAIPLRSEMLQVEEACRQSGNELQLLVAAGADLGPIASSIAVRSLRHRLAAPCNPSDDAIACTLTPWMALDLLEPLASFPPSQATLQIDRFAQLKTNALPFRITDAGLLQKLDDAGAEMLHLTILVPGLRQHSSLSWSMTIAARDLACLGRQYADDSHATTYNCQPPQPDLQRDSLYRAVTLHQWLKDAPPEAQHIADYCLRGQRNHGPAVGGDAEEFIGAAKLLLVDLTARPEVMLHESPEDYAARLAAVDFCLEAADQRLLGSSLASPASRSRLEHIHGAVDLTRARVAPSSKKYQAAIKHLETAWGLAAGLAEPWSGQALLELEIDLLEAHQCADSRERVRLDHWASEIQSGVIEIAGLSGTLADSYIADVSRIRNGLKDAKKHCR